jgi:manganese efflux pump family protein
MSYLELFSLAVALAMDSLAVSITSGSLLGRRKWKYFFRIALYMGFFQGFMPLLGWLAGVTFQSYIQHLDHWIAFGLLTFIGGKMIHEAYQKHPSQEPCYDPHSKLTLLGLAVATSIDALAVGVTFALLNLVVIVPVIIIGCTTFLLSFAGSYLGARVGDRLSGKMEWVGGSILILMGLKILVEHLFLQ